MSPAFLDAVLGGRRDEVGFDIPADWPDAHDRRFLTARLLQLRARPEIEEWLVYAIVLPESTMIGHVGFHGPPGTNALKAGDALEVGYTIFPPHRGRGYAKEAVLALIEWAAREHEIGRFLASIAPDNEPSLAIAKRLGFTKIGRHWDEEDGEELEFELRVG